MARAPFQILAFPYCFSSEGTPLYALLQREAKTGGYWQGIAGGGEDRETPLETALRETKEETGLTPITPPLQLQSLCMVPVEAVCGFLWGPDVLVIPEYSFGINAGSQEIVLSHEHQAFQWSPYEEAVRLLKWDSNKTALWELNQRLSIK